MRPRLAQLVMVGLLTAAAGLQAADNEVSVKLTGIAECNGQPRALLEIISRPGRPVIRPILGIGERVEGVEVKDIDTKSGRVSVINNGVETFYVVDDGEPAADGRTLHFKSADLTQVLEIYQELSGRTVLRPPNLPGAKLDLKTERLSDPEAMRVLEQLLRAQRIATLPQGDKFVFVVRADQTNRLSLIPDPPATPKNQKKLPPELNNFPPGLMKFTEADVGQVLEIYQELSARTVLRPAGLPAAKITVRSQGEMTRHQAIWMLDAVLALADIATFPRGDQFVFVVRADQTNRLSLIPDPPAAPKDEEKLAPGLIKFTEANISQVLDICQELWGRTVLKPSDLPSPRITVRNQTGITRLQAIWMLDAVLALADIAMVPHSDKFVFVLPGIENPRVPAFEPNTVSAGGNAQEVLSAGAIKFTNSDVSEVLAVYASLLGRKPIPLDRTMPAVKLTIRTQTNLTRSEAISALDAIAALNRLQFVLVGADEVKVLPTALGRRETNPAQ